MTETAWEEEKRTQVTVTSEEEGEYGAGRLVTRDEKDENLQI